MPRRSPNPALAFLVAAAVTIVGPVPAVGNPAPSVSDTPTTAERSPAPPGVNAGPPYHYVTVLNGQFPFIPLRDKAMLTRTKHGYRFRTGGQNSHLVVTHVGSRLRFVDTGTTSFKKLSPACRRSPVKVGVAATCDVPGRPSVRRPLLIEVWPRLGNDFTDTSTLSARFAVTVLADAGKDVANLGAGPDFFNGALGRDRVRGGAGNDWIRSGPGNDDVGGGRGNDYLVAQAGRDTMGGAAGNDHVSGGDGDDRLWGNDGDDFLLCGTGRDTANVDGADRVFGDCEAVDRR